MKPKEVFLCLSLATFLAGVTHTNAAPGDLLTTFGALGKVTTALGTGSDAGNGVATQKDGKIVVAGQASNGNNNDFAVARYNVNGSLDDSFGTGGKVLTPIGTREDVGAAVAIQSDGKIVVVGRSNNGADTDFAVVRYTTAGSLDTTFNGTGTVTTAIGTGNDLALGVTLQADGKIVVVGQTSNGANNDFALVRYNSNGSLDTSFNGTGKVTTGVGTGTDIAKSVVVQSDGKIIIVGQAQDSKPEFNFALARYNAHGSLDDSFGTGGTVMTPISEGRDEGFAVALQADGKILVTGYIINSAGNYEFALARYNTNGSLDDSFGTGGSVTTAFQGGAGVSKSVVVQSNGKIVIGGHAFTDMNADFAVARYDAEGKLDTTFGNGGKVITPIGFSSDSGNSLALQLDGSIVLAGVSFNGLYNDFAVVVYEGDKVGPTSVIGTRNGVLTLAWPAIFTGYSVEQSTTLSSWTAAELTPAIVNGENVVTISTNNGSAFFRIRK